MEKIKLDVGFANLVVEKYNSDYPVPEMIVCLEDKTDGTAIQDIAIIRRSTNNEAIKCLVWSDENDSNYTHEFNISCNRIVFM